MQMQMRSMSECEHRDQHEKRCHKQQKGKRERKLGEEREGKEINQRRSQEQLNEQWNEQWNKPRRHTTILQEKSKY